MISYSLGWIYLRKISLVLVLIVMLINISVILKFYGRKNGIDLLSSVLCSLFYVAILPKDPSANERTSRFNDLTIEDVKRLSFKLTSGTLALFMICPCIIQFGITKYHIMTFPDIAWTFEQYSFFFFHVLCGLFVLCVFSCIWFKMTFYKEE